MIDEARVWNRALDASEILANKDLEPTSGTGLVARWGINEGTGTTINSSVGTFPGTLTNSPSWVDGFPLPDTTPPAAPTGLTAIRTNSSVALDWNNNTEPDLAGYNVYRSGTPGGPFTKVNTALVTASAYTDTGLTNGNPYYYVVRAVDTSDNESPDSNETYSYPTSDLGAALEFTTASGTYVTFGDPAKLDLAPSPSRPGSRRPGPALPTRPAQTASPSSRW